MQFELTQRQKQISNALCSLVEEDKSVLINAVCGAGKTELVVAMISQQLKEGKKVGFAIARRQVVLEIKERLSEIFPTLKVVAVCQGYTRRINGDIIVCTTHQLFRYRRYFDVLIIDEPDAFPYKNDPVLHGLAANSCKGQMVYLTATPSPELKKQVQEGKLTELYLPRRPHGHDLCVPEVVYGNKIFLLLRGLFWVQRQIKQRKPVIFFVPSKKTGRKIAFLFNVFFKTAYLDSSVEEKDKLIQDFKSGSYPVMVSTTVLERGITIPGVNIAIYHCDHQVFDEASLIQCSGRVGRSFKDPDGECLFLAFSRNKNIDNCLASITKANNYE